MELSQLQHWILDERCRLVTLLGIGGIGKSALATKLGMQVQGEFDAVVWRSLQNAPPVEDKLTSILQFLLWALRKEVAIPQSFDQKLSKLMECLINHRCLLILDNLETILISNGQTGQCRPGYEGYGQLLKQIGEVPHNSCVLITTREKIRDIVALEGEKAKVKCWQLEGLNPTEGRNLFDQKGKFIATDQEWQVLIKYYGGNPLALKMVAAGAQELFNGRITTVLVYLHQGAVIFEDINDLLSCQFQRLSILEQEVMYWLAINREPASLADLSSDLVTLSDQRQLPQVIKSLLQRSLIEKNGEHFFLQPVVMEYVTQRFVKQICQELVSQKLIEENSTSVQLFKSHALIKATAKDYIRDSQKQLIVQPLIEELLTSLGSEQELLLIFQNLLAQQKQQAAVSSAYGGGNILNLLAYLEVDLRGYDFSDLTIWQAYLQNVNLAGTSFQNSTFDKSVFASQFKGIYSLALSPDGKLLATGDVEGRIDLWQTVDIKHLFTFKGHEAGIMSLTFSPDGTILASGGFDNLVKLWDIETGNCLNVLRQHTDKICSIDFSPDGEILASASLVSAGIDTSICLWNVHRGQCINTLNGHSNWVLAVEFCPVCVDSVEGKNYILASSSVDGNIRLWNITQGICINTLEGHVGGVPSIRFSPNGKILASGGRDCSIKLWDVNTGSCIFTLHGHKDMVFSVSFSPDGRTIATASYDRDIRLWDVSLGTCIKLLQGHNSQVNSVIYSADGQMLISSSMDSSIRWWDINKGMCVRTLFGKEIGTRSLDFRNDGHILAAGGSDGLIRLWDIASGYCSQVLQGHTDWIWSVKFSPDGKLLASGSDDNRIKLWDAYTGECVRRDSLHGIPNLVGKE